MSNLKKLSPGMFSPSRLKTLHSCKWQYELKYNQKIYPKEKIIEPHSELGSAMHYFAENYDPSKSKFDPMEKLAGHTWSEDSHIKFLLIQAQKRFVLTEEQITELNFMVKNLVYYIWPEITGDSRDDPFTPKEVKTEENVRGDVTYHDKKGNPVKMPLNMKIDRRVTTEDGRVLIMDYKKGQASVTKHKFQLLFYVTAYAQKKRCNVKDIEIWLIFPNEKKNWIQKVRGDELLDDIPSFEEEIAETIEELDRMQANGGYTEEDATPSFLCNFCPFQATQLCPTSLMLHRADHPENEKREFVRTQYIKGHKVEEEIDPKDILTSSSAW